MSVLTSERAGKKAIAKPGIGRGSPNLVGSAFSGPRHGRRRHSTQRLLAAAEDRIGEGGTPRPKRKG